MINRLFVLSLVLVTPIQRIYALCNLCAQGLEGLSWPHHYVDTNGKTCAQKSIDMAYINNENSPNCQSEIAAYRGRCCGPNEPGPIQQTPTKPPTYNGPMGPYSKCELCRDGDFPSSTSMVINMLYIGAGSCAQFYDYGQGGNIQSHLCDALQFFAYEPCGCGEFNQNAQQAPPGNSPQGTPLPTPKPTAPASIPPPTYRPTPYPSNRPTPRPSPRPTPRPTPYPSPRPSPRPTSRPTPYPSPRPSPRPTPYPSPRPSPRPTSRPTPNPTPRPTPSPTPQPDSGSPGKNGHSIIQKTPDSDGKDSMKIGNQDSRGGQGGRRRHLKGSR